MKIATLYANWEEFGEKASTPKTWVDELRSCGHEVDIYNLYAWNGKKDPRTNVHKYCDEGFNQLYWDIQKGKQCDAIFILDYGPYQNLKLNKENFPNQVLIKECGDDPQAHGLHLQTAKLFDVVVSPDKRCMEHYKQLGINALWQPHFADHVFYPRPSITPAARVSTSCGVRGNGLTNKLEKYFGQDFINRRVCNGNEHAELLCAGQIVFHKSQYGEIGRRIFEGAAIKRMVLTDRLDPSTGLQEIFKENEEIVFYDDAQDAINKIEHYSFRDEEREKIAEAGHNKVMQEHTIKARVNQLITAIEELK